MMHPDLAELLDGSGATERLRTAGLDIAAAVPDYIRHKPETTVVSYALVTPSGAGARAYVRWCAEPERAQALHAKALTMRPRDAAAGPGVAMVGDSAVVYAFPNDARLRRLRWYSDPDKIKRSLAELVPDARVSGRRSSVAVLRYKPERRLVAKVSLGVRGRDQLPLLVRYSATSDGGDRCAVAAALLAAGVSVPRPIAVLDHDRVTIDEFLPGTELRATPSDAAPAPGAVADAMLAFHAAPLDIAPRRHAVAATSGLAGLASLHNDLAAATTAITEALADRADLAHEPDVPIHGDLHDRNLLVDGSTVSFVDLERVRRGRPSEDLGYFLGTAAGQALRHGTSGQTTIDMAQATIEEYRRSRAVPEANLRRAVALALVEQAVLCARHLEDGWPETARTLLTEARARIGNRIPNQRSRP